MITVSSINFYVSKGLLLLVLGSVSVSLYPGRTLRQIKFPEISPRSFTVFKASSGRISPRSILANIRSPWASIGQERYYRITSTFCILLIENCASGDEAQWSLDTSFWYKSWIIEHITSLICQSQLFQTSPRISKHLQLQLDPQFRMLNDLECE